MNTKVGLRTFLLSLSLIIVFVACKKEEPDELILGTWKITGLTADVPYDWNNAGIMETDLYNVFTACQKDNFLQFSGSGIGKTRSSCNDPGTDIKWYNLNPSSKAPPFSIQIRGNGFIGGKYEVQTLDKKRLVMRQRQFLRTDYHTYSFSKL